MKGTLVSAWTISGLLLAGGISVGAIAQETPESLASDVQLISLDPATEAEILSQVDEQVAAEDFEGAIALLEALSAEGSENPAVYSRLGALYLDAGRLAEEALVPYSQALGFATAAQDMVALAQIRQGLAEVYWQMGNSDEATRLLNEARDRYEALGDVDSVAEIDGQVTAISAEPTEADDSARPVFRGGCPTCNL
ncbi:MAG: tetratricopeptide repeat protein [Leptolyngbyaceae bacterium]|nr:tetratricopeptide repeat protein [Leptolyngbyaceae bacterium]